MRIVPSAWLALWLLLGAPSAAVTGDAGPEQSRDPFEPVRDVVQEHEATPLERFPVNELRLVATVDGVDPPRALIEDPNGLGFIVRPGITVGTERATIVSIGAGKIVLETTPSDSATRRQVTFAGGQGG